MNTEESAAPSRLFAYEELWSNQTAQYCWSIPSDLTKNVVIGLIFDAPTTTLPVPLLQFWLIIQQYVNFIVTYNDN